MDLLHSIICTVGLLESTTLYRVSTWLYFPLFYTMALLDNTSLSINHGSLFDSTLLYSTMALLVSTILLFTFTSHNRTSTSFY